MSEYNKDLERQARHIAKHGMGSVEHLETAIARARELLEAGEIEPSSDEESPFIPQSYPWELSERRLDLPKQSWLGTVEDFVTGQGHSIYFAAGFAHDEDEFRRCIALELGPVLAHRTKVKAAVDPATFRDMFLPENVETALTDFDKGKERPAVMMYIAKYYANYS